MRASIENCLVALSRYNRDLGFSHKKMLIIKMKYIVILLVFFLTIAHTHAQSVTVSQIPSGTICSGTSVEFTANPSGFPGQVFYQWYLNGTAIPGATSANYTTSTLNNGDQVFVQCSNSTVDDMVPGSEFYYDATNPNSYRGGSATVYDLSGNNRHGTVQNFIAQGNAGASWNATNGGVFNFNGTNQYITTGWTPSNTMSFQLAFRSLEAYGANWNRGLITTFANRGTPSIDWNGFYIGTQPINRSSNNGLHFYFDNNDNGDIGTTNSTFTSTSAAALSREQNRPPLQTRAHDIHHTPPASPSSRSNLCKHVIAVCSALESSGCQKSMKRISAGTSPSLYAECMNVVSKTTPVPTGAAS